MVESVLRFADGWYFFNLYGAKAGYARKNNLILITYFLIF